MIIPGGDKLFEGKQGEVISSDDIWMIRKSLCHQRGRQENGPNKGPGVRTSLTNLGERKNSNED